jgi:hypothetical protein
MEVISIFQYIVQDFPFPFSLIEFHWISIQFNWVWILLNFELNLVKFEFDSMLWNSISTFECSSLESILNWIWIQFNGIRISCNVFEYNSSYTHCHSIFSFKWNLTSTKQLFFPIISLLLAVCNNVEPKSHNMHLVWNNIIHYL